MRSVGRLRRDLRRGGVNAGATSGAAAASRMTLGRLLGVRRVSGEPEVPVHDPQRGHRGGGGVRAIASRRHRLVSLLGA